MSYDFGNTFTRKALKSHYCEWCGYPILKGEVHKQFKGMWQDEWQDWRMHSECYDAYQKDYDNYYDGFTPGDGEPPERIRNAFSNGVQSIGRTN